MGLSILCTILVRTDEMIVDGKVVVDPCRMHNAHRSRMARATAPEK